MKKILLYLVIVTAITLPLVRPLFQPGFFDTHDAGWMTIRLSAFHQSLKDGQFPVRWSRRLNHEYGYPLFNFIYPLPFYLGEIAYIFTREFSAAIKMVFAISVIGSAASMFIWLKSRFNFLSSLAGSVLYVYTPYRLVDIYVRGSIGEVVGFIFIPLIFFSIDRLKQQQRFGLIMGAITIAATILSHNVYVVFALLGFIYGITVIPSARRKQLIAMFGLAACLTAYFWLPAISEIKYVRLGQINVTNPLEHLTSFQQLVIPSWGYDAVGSTTQTPMSLQLGLVNIGILIISGIVIRSRKAPPQTKFFFITSIITIFLMHHFSTLIWKLLPAATIIQHPWRLLSVIAFTTAVLAGSIASVYKSRFVAIGIIIAAIIATVSYAQPQNTNLVEDSFFSTNEDTTSIWNEYMPVWVTTFPSERLGDRVKFIKGRGFATDISENNLGMGMRIEASEDSTITVPIIYYPGWQASVNGKLSLIDYSHNGLISIDVPKEISLVNLYWKETKLRQTVNYLSLITLLAIISHVACTIFWSPAPAPSQSKKSPKPR